MKIPVCRGETVQRVEVFDNEAERLLWHASAPRTAEGGRGALTLWEADDFLNPDPGAQPRSLQMELAASFVIAGSDGRPAVAFTFAEVRAAQLPRAQYWTYSGPMTAEAIDNQVTCGSDR